MAIKFSGNARHKMTTINNKLANLATYGWLLYMVVLLVTRGGGGNSAYERGEDACRKF